MTLQSVGAPDPEIQDLAPWFHNLHLPDGRQTAPDHPLGDFPAFKWAELGPALPEDLSGARVLDIGCNAGFYSLALAGRGASVLGVDVDPHYLRQAAWARERHGISETQLELRQMQIYELAGLDERFDLVLFLGVFYHLRYPLLALDIVAGLVRDRLVLQTLTMPGEELADPPPDLGIDDRERMREPGWPAMAFIEHRLAGDPTNWWAPNRAAVEAMLRSAGFRLESRPGHEMFLARRLHEAPEPDELRAVLSLSSDPSAPTGPRRADSR